LAAYEEFLDGHSLADEADVLRLAIRRLETDPDLMGRATLILVPKGHRAAGLERRFLTSLPGHQRFEIEHPGHRQDGDGPQRKPGSLQFFRAVGEINEVREVLRRCLAQAIPLDEVEILHTDAETYVGLIYATARRYFDENDRRDGLPVTFAEGIPTSLSRPGRALAAWLQWIADGFRQRILIEMIGEGLLNCGDERQLTFSYLARLLRPIAFGNDPDNYLPKLDEQIAALRRPVPHAADDGDGAREMARERRLRGLESLRKLISRLLKLSRGVTAGSAVAVAEAAEKFIETSARSVSELDRYAAEALTQQLQSKRLWFQRLGVSDAGAWLVGLAAQTRVLGSGPRPGHLHVAHVGAGGHSGRQHTFVIGLDDRRFPGAALQDPILLDRERAGLNPHLPTSASQLRHKIDDLADTLSRLSGWVTLSWPCQNLIDDRETFPSSVVLGAYRQASGRHDTDLEALNAAVGAPASFAPTAAEKALDESDRWLWRFSEDDARGVERTALVETRFPHLARGAARLRDTAGFGPFNGFVPQAGRDLDPFAADGPVLSVSALETAGRCPLAYFFQRALHLYPLEEADDDPDRWLDAAQFGLLLHDVFRRVMDEISTAGNRPEFERDHTRLAEILQEATQAWRNEVPPPNENVVRSQYWRLVRTSRIFLQAEEQHCQTSRPRYFEVALGVPRVDGPNGDDPTPLDRSDPVRLDLPSGKSIRAHGKIDRVDETGPLRYAVWDYKVGGGHGYDPVDPFRQGRRVQSVLYLRMIETALRDNVDSQAIVERFGYFFPGLRTHGLRIAWSADQLQSGLATLERLGSLVTEGAFSATDDAGDCRYCDYKPICRDVQRVTSQSKSLLEQDDLVPLRHFRGLRRG
ncbi:MAG TPA: PD-(D/E)XK nuclease family protein, partial [Pirellulales bacterium]|nr:PD-(D/E)XK nuclease family protein [Pirellulales bacterium]